MSDADDAKRAIREALKSFFETEPDPDKSERELIAACLETVVERVRSGEIVGFKAEWKKGDRDMNWDVLMPAPELEFIRLDFKREV